MNLSQCSLRVAAVILGELRSLYALPLPDVEPLIRSHVGDEARAHVPVALNVLFLLGLANYQDSSDSLVYVPPRRRSAA